MKTSVKNAMTTQVVAVKPGVSFEVIGMVSEADLLAGMVLSTCDGGTSQPARCAGGPPAAR